MNYYNLQCEVPGAIGNETIYDKNIIPWTVKKLHLIFEGWLGGEILSSSSCVIVTSNLKNKLGFTLTGIIGYESFHYDTSIQYKKLFPNLELPSWERIMIDSKAFEDDFALTYYNGLYNQLIISEKARQFLDDFNLGNYRIILVEKI